MKPGIQTRWNSPCDRSEPVFGYLSLRILLLCATYVIADAHVDYMDWEKGETVSVAGYLLPEAFFQSEHVFEICRCAFFFRTI